MSETTKHTKDTKRRLPPGWRWVRMGEVITEALPGFAIGERDPQGVIQLRMNNVDTRGRLIWNEFIRVPADEETVAKYRLLPGDVMFNNTNSTELVGKSAIFTGHAEQIVYSNHFTRLRTRNEQLDPGFLAAWLLHQWQRKVFENLCNRWIGQSAVKSDKLLALELPLPPLAEQRRIAAVLNERMAAVERARAAAQAQLDDAKTLSAACLRQALPRSGQDLPAGWRWARLGEVCEDQTGTRDPRVEPGKTFRYVDISCVDNLQKRIIEARNLQGNDAPSRARQVIRKNDVLVATTRPNLNAVAKVPPELDDEICSTGFCVLRARAGLFPDYLFAFVRHEAFVSALSDLVKGALYPAVTDGQVKAQSIALPPLAEQQRIAAELNAQMAAVEKLRAGLEAQLNDINALPAALLRQAFNGEL